MYVLIIMFFVSGTGSVTTQEFNTIKNCEDAAQMFNKKLIKSGTGEEYSYYSAARCFKK